MRPIRAIGPARLSAEERFAADLAARDRQLLGLRAKEPEPASEEPEPAEEEPASEEARAPRAHEEGTSSPTAPGSRGGPARARRGARRPGPGARGTAGEGVRAGERGARTRRGGACVRGDAGSAGPRGRRVQPGGANGGVPARGRSCEPQLRELRRAPGARHVGHPGKAGDHLPQAPRRVRRGGRPGRDPGLPPGIPRRGQGESEPVAIVRLFGANRGYERPGIRSRLPFRSAPSFPSSPYPPYPAYPYP